MAVSPEPPLRSLRRSLARAALLARDDIASVHRFATRAMTSRNTPTGTLTEPRMATAKGSTLRATLAYVEGAVGAERARAVLARLEPETRARVTEAQPTEE